MAERISKENFDSSVKNAKFALVDFYSDSCIPCKRLNPILYEIESELKDKISVFKVNANFDSELAQKFNVMSLPTLVLFKDGAELNRKTGILPKQDFLDWLNEKIYTR